MPQWRASPSRPAPPVASTHPDNPTASFDSLFTSTSASRSSRTTSAPSGSSSLSATGRTLSSSSSAYSLLSRKMAEMEDEDDRMSIRSGVSVRGELDAVGTDNSVAGSSSVSVRSGHSVPSARVRATSSADSSRHAPGRRDELDEDRMEVDEHAGSDTKASWKGKGKETDAVSLSSSSKRQRVRAPSLLGLGTDRSPRRLSTCPVPGNAGNLTLNPRPTLSTTSTMTADDLMPSMKKKPDRAASASSASTSTKSLSRPLHSTASASTLRPSRSPSVRNIATSASHTEPALSTSPVNSLAPSQRSDQSSLASRSWFGRTPAAGTVPNASEQTSRTSATSDQKLPSDQAAPISPPNDTLAPEASGPTLDSSIAAPDIVTSVQQTGATAGQPTTVAPISAAIPPRGWLSLLTRTAPSTASNQPEAPENHTLPLSAPALPANHAGDDDPDEATPPATPRAARSSNQVHVIDPPADHAPGTSTTNPAQSAPRASWFAWGRNEASAANTSPAEDVVAASAVPDPAPAAAPVALMTESPDSSATSPAVKGERSVESPSSPQVEATAASSGWLRAFATALTAGPAPSAEALVDQRRREAWALRHAAQNAAQMQKAIEAAPVVEDPVGKANGNANQDKQPQEQLTPAQQIKHRASGSGWNLSSSLFSRTPNSLRGPLASLGVGSSAASTRSHGSSHATDTAPSSPQLRAQPDHTPVKPLTGSIRSATRQGRPPPNATEPPPPPVVDNLVLPTFSDTFLRPPRSFAPKKSSITRAVSAVSAYLFHRPPEELATARLAQAQLAAGVNPAALPSEMENDPAERLPKALEAVGEPARLERIKRVVTIGVHGWFTSNNVIKSVMGEQTGTSVKFATMMHDAVQTYLEAHDLGSFNIQAIALEGQGMVEERVSKLYDQLVGREEWVQAIKMADAVFLATHSQGCVVSTQLLARMLDQGLITGTQIHLLAMCGIAQGPFVYLYQSIALAPYFNYLESAPARELFEFQNPESVAAIKFLESLRLLLNAGAKVTSVGSINDQVVPLYSALFSGVDHPGIVRAVFIDSDAFRTSDFLANLVVFSARLRNAGLSDHDLVYHVSEALAGALTGVGHSRIYEEADVYRLAVRYHFETTTLVEPPTSLDVRLPAPPLSMSFNPRDRRNPYLLTWALRGIIEDPQVRELFSHELTALREAYETWRPQTKVLKDVKLKLEGIRLMTPQRSGKL